LADEKRQLTQEEIDANVRKANAEALKAENESKKLEAEVLKIKHEADEAKSKAERVKYDTENHKFDHERNIERRERELADFRHNRIYNFFGPVREDSCGACISELNYWDKVDDSNAEYEIIFDSPGGGVFAGMALYDYIQQLRKKGHKITTATRGMAASMGGILLQAGDHRAMGAESFILIHEIATGAIGKVADIEDEMKLCKMMTDRVVKIFANRSHLSEAKIRAGMNRKDWWISSDQALKYGLVDEVR